MNRILKLSLAVLLATLGLTAFVGIPNVRAPTDEIENSIVAGLAWLALQQNADGSWDPGYVGSRVAYTGMAVLKFEERAIDLELDPLDPSYEYYDQVRNGLDFIFSMADTIDISVQPAGDPDSNGNGIGVRFDPDDDFHYSYATGIAAMAIAASTHPEMTVSVAGSDVDTWTYEDVLQDVVDYLAFGQIDYGTYEGGWGYYENYGQEYDSPWADNSNTGYVVLGLIYAETPPPHGFGLPTPGWVKDELNIWIDYIQNDIDADTNDGGSGYSDPEEWVNLLKTGTLLQEMAFVGDALGTQRVQDALEYIERHWNDPNNDPGWKGSPVHKQAMYTLMKGFQAFDIDYIDTDGDAVRDDDWFNEMADALLAEQFPAGHWDADYWVGDYVMPTCWALLTLEKAAPVIVPVGGLEAPLNTFTMLAPWILLALASFGAIVAAKRKIKY